STDGSIPAALYDSTVDEIRKLIFEKPLGNFTSESLFKTVIQPTRIVDALNRKTKVRYSSEAPLALVQQAIRNVVSRPVRPYVPGSIQVPDFRPIPYIKRGTYIQITELGAILRARSIASPGIAESGPHAFDQVDLARAWMYKPMVGW